MDREALKRWMIAGVMTTSNISYKAFSDWTMRFLFWRAGLSPLSEQIALRCFDEEAERVKALLTSNLSKLVEDGAILTLTLTQQSNGLQEQFLGITLHCSEKIPSIADDSMDFICRLETQANAQCMEQALLQALKSVGLSLTNIRGFTTDDAPVMRELAIRLKNASAPYPFYHQCCFAQVLDMAVLDAFNETGEIEVSGDPEHNVDDSKRAMTKQNRRSAKELIGEVRAIIRASAKISKSAEDDKSASRSGGIKRQLKLKLDVRSKWTTTHRMLGDFVEHERQLRHSLAKNPEKMFSLSENDVDAIKEMIRALDIVAEASNRLSLVTTYMSLADRAMQAMLRKLQASPTVFSRKLRRNLCLRILRSRGIAPRLARYVTDRREQTDLDVWLEGIREETIMSGDKDLCDSFMESGDIAAEISLFRDLENEKRRKRAEAIGDDPSWDVYERYVIHKWREPREMAPVQELMEVHAEFGNVCNALPEDLIGTMKMLKAVSVTPSHALSATRHAQRFCQEIRDDSKFSDFLLLRTFYNKSKPWEKFREVKQMADFYNLGFNNDDDGELCSDCEHEWDDSD